MAAFKGISVAVLLVVFDLAGGISFSAEANTIGPHEAEILIYLTPDAHSIRNQGKRHDVELHLNSSPNLNHGDYYYFEAYDTGGEGASVTVGFYAVNKHTADVWDTTMDRMIKSRELAGIQRLLRSVHAMDERVIRQFRSRKY